jgi:hypothetical protein
MVGMQAEADKIVAESEKAGSKAGKAFSGMFDRETAAAGTKTTAALKAQADSAVNALEQSSARAVKAHDLAADAAGRVRIAETNLGAVRQKYAEDSVQYIKAEEGLAKAKRDTATASGVAQDAAMTENKVMDDLAAKQDALAAKHDAVAKSSGAMAGALKTAATVGVGAMVLALADGTKQASEFNRTTELLVTGGGLDPKNLDAARQGMLGMAQDVGYTANQLGQGMRNITQATSSLNWSVADQLSTLKAAAQGASNENADLSTVTDALTTTLTNFHEPASKAADVMSKMVTAVSLGKTNFEDFSGALGTVEGVAAQYHVSQDEIWADMDEFTKHGFSAQQAAQDLAHAIEHIGGTPTAQMATALGTLGFNADSLQKSLGTQGLAGTLDMVMSKVASMPQLAGGSLLLSTYNNSKVDAGRAQTMYGGLNSADQGQADDLMKNVASGQKASAFGKDAQLQQWFSSYQKSTGFSDLIKKTGENDTTAAGMLKQVFGDAPTLQTALQVGGANYADQQATQRQIDAGHAGPGGNVKDTDKMHATVAQREQDLKAGSNSLLVSVGETTQGPLNGFLSGLEDATSWLTKHNHALQDGVLALGGLSLGLAGIKGLNMVGGLFGNKTLGGDAVKGAVKYGVGKPIQSGAKGIAAGARGIGGGISNVAESAGDWWDWTGKAKAAAVKDFAATKASAVTESLASGGAWAKQGVVAAGAWAGMQVKAVGAFVATKASALTSAAETGAAWLASNTKAAASFALTEGRAILAATATGAVTAAQWLWDAAMDANPIGAVVLGVTALVGGIVLLVTHWNDVTKAWDWTYKNVLTPVGHWFQHVWSDDVVPPFKTATNDITGFFKGMGSDIHGVWVDIVHGVAWVVDKIADVFDALPSSIHIPGTDISTPDFKGMGKDLHAFSGMAMDYKADGGLFRGVGGPREDKNLVAVSDGEYWVNAAAAAKNLPLLNRINRGEQVLARADGGLVGAPDLSSDPSLGADGSVTASSTSPTTASTGAGTKSGLQVALDQIRAHLATMYLWGGGNLSGGVDCSGLVGDGQLLATGGTPDHRLGTTDTLLGGSWPGMIKGATNNDYFVVGVNDHHMVGKILGQGIEARQSGEHIRMGSDAADPFDQQFIAQYHLDPTLISPPYQPGASDDPTATGGVTGTSADDKATKYRAAAQKELDAAKKHDADAQKYMGEAAKYKDGVPAAKAKHMTAMANYLTEAQKADALAARTTGAVKQRHLDAAAHDRDLAQKAQDAAGKVGGAGQKYLDEATKARQEAADERKRAQQDMAKAQTATSTPAKTTGSKAGADTTNGWMTFEQFGQNLGGLGADAFLDSTGLDNSLLANPNNSAVLRIGKQLSGVRLSGKAPDWGASPFLPAQPATPTQDQDLSSLLPATHDLGGPIPPGLSLVNNRTGGDEVLVINPQLMGQRRPEPAAVPRGRGPGGGGPAVVIQSYYASSDSQAEANRLGRTVSQYARQR